MNNTRVHYEHVTIPKQVRNNLLEDNAYISLIAPNGKCMLDTVIDNNTIRNSINGIVITSGNNTVNMQSTVISRLTTEDVAVPMSGSYAPLLTSQNSFGYNQLVMYKCGDEVTENFIVGDVNMDGKINRIKAMLVDKGKTNRWLAMQLSKDLATVSKRKINRI